MSDNDAIAELMRRRESAVAMEDICEGTVPISMVFKAQRLAYEDAIRIVQARHALQHEAPEAMTTPTELDEAELDRLEGEE